MQLFGSWVTFLREVGEYTEASYHYPQGTHLGHILSILYFFGSGKRAGSPFDDDFIRLRGGFGEGRPQHIGDRSNTNSRLQWNSASSPMTAHYPDGANYALELTPLGRELYAAPEASVKTVNLDFSRGDDGIPTTRMDDENAMNGAIRTLIRKHAKARRVFFSVFLQMHAVQQMLAFLYHIEQKTQIPRSEIYEQFFQAPFVKQYCDEEGIEETTLEAARRRCPFLLNILEACDIVETERSEIIVKTLALSPFLVKRYEREEAEKSAARLNALRAAWPNKPELLDAEDLSILRELFGRKFLTPQYHLARLGILEV